LSLSTSPRAGLDLRAALNHLSGREPALILFILGLAAPFDLTSTEFPSLASLTKHNSHTWQQLFPLSQLRKSGLSQEIVLSWAESGFLLEAWLCSGLSLLGHGSAFKRIRRSSAQTSGVLNSHFQKIGTSDAFGAFSILARWKIFLSLTSLTVAG
jgi:hypothetical protein